MSLPADTAPAPPGLLRRLAAMVYDGLLIFGVCFVATALLLVMRGGRAPQPGEVFYQLYLLILWFAFVGWFWTHGGQTLGMRAWKLRLIDLNGGPPSWKQALLRFAAAGLSIAAMGLGYWSALWDPEKRTWHDRISKTRVTSGAVRPVVNHLGRELT